MWTTLFGRVRVSPGESAIDMATIYHPKASWALRAGSRDSIVGLIQTLASDP